MKKFKRLFILLGLSMVTTFALLRLGDIDVSAETLDRVNWGWLALAFIALYFTIVIRGLRWRRILKTIGWPISFVYALTLLMAGLFISAILPARLGDVGRVAMLKQDYNVPVSHSIASIATERALDIFSILTLMIIGMLWVLQSRAPVEVWRLIIGTTILFAIGLVALLTTPRLEGRLRDPFPRWRRRIGLEAPPQEAITTGSNPNDNLLLSPKNRSDIKYTLWAFYQKTLDFGFSLIHGVRALGKNPLVLIIAVIESLGIWLGDALIIHFSLIGIGVPSPLGVSLFSGMAADLAAAVPLTPGALGQFDAALVGLLQLFDISLVDSSLTVILVRFLSLWTLIPITGAVTYIFGFSRALDLNRKAIETDKLATSSAPSAPAPAES